MEKSKNLRVSEDCWERVKLAAIKDRMTMREWVERAVHAYLGNGISVRRGDVITIHVPVDPPKPLTEKHWTPDD